jgi:small conductance mechanosensitive channel
MELENVELSEKVAQVVAMYGAKIVGVIALVFAAWLIAAYVRRLVRKGLRSAKFDETLTRFISNAVRWIILAVAGVSILGVFGVEATSFAALLGAAGLAIGLAFQGTLSNLAAGIMLLIFRPFKVCDVVEVGGVKGTVDEIDLFSTVIDTIDHRRVYVPNSSVFGSTIENYSHFKTRRVDVPFATDTYFDIVAVRREIEKRLATLPKIQDRPPPALFLKGLTFKATEWEIQAWCDTSEALAIRQLCLTMAREAIDVVRPTVIYPAGTGGGDD